MMIDAEAEIKASARRRLRGDAGIAIGPILFIVAILGVLAAAIAAGSGSFTTSGANEGSKLKAAALIDIGQNLKLGFERINASVDMTNVGLTGTTAVTDLFSPTGGGISFPSDALAVPTKTWHYLYLYGMGLGTTAGNLVATLEIPADVCDQVNVKANGAALTGTNGGTTVTDAGLTLTANGDPDAPVNVATEGWDYLTRTIGCQKNADDVYFFFQVMGIR